MQTLSFKKKILLFIFFVVIFPFPVSAARVYLDTQANSAEVGDTIIVDLKIDTEGQIINVVEGIINLTGGNDLVQVKDISIAGSASTIWPVPPALSVDKKSISFTAGIARGLNLADATLLKIIFLAEKSGTFELNPANFSVYLNDGKGTLVTTSSSSLEIKINESSSSQSSNDWSYLIDNDKNPPEQFKILLDKDDSVFEGQKFISFNTTDHESGIDYYEIREGDLSPVRSTNTYVLKNQNIDSVITVTAYDKAGNTRVATLNTAGKSPTYTVVTIFIFIFVLLIIYKLFNIFKRRFHK